MLWAFVLVLVAGMTWVALIYTGPVPTLAAFGEWNDKALHVAAFALLAALLVLPGPAPRALLILVLCGAGLELVQLAFPMRQASLADFAASIAGVALGWVVGETVGTVIAFVTGKKR